MTISVRILSFSLFCLCLVPLQISPAAAEVRHKLSVRLVPDKHLLVGHDRVTLPADTGRTVSFSLAPEADIRSLRLNGSPATYRSSSGRVQVTIPPESANGTLKLSIDYAAVFDDPIPDAPANLDNPGFGVTGIVSPEGTFLLGGAGWYPRFSGQPARLSITVAAPRGITAVTAGRDAGQRDRQKQTLSFWEVERAVDPLALAAGRFLRSQDSLDGVQVATYFLPETQPLAERYLAASKRYLRLFEDRIGPYPFQKFAVVENFFPTGYGFPSFTLLGGRVLRLPFILETSLAHEIAHCWWGNGVRVDRSRGNWSEGLTTYVADHFLQERDSAEAARQYRWQWLRNYAWLVDRQDGFPVSEFEHRTSPVSKVIGYDKSAMVFHMLRSMLGEKAFWDGLRQVYADMRFETASWQDFQQAFTRAAGPELAWDLDRFFEQWIHWNGAPLLALKDVLRKETDNGWRISGRVVQQQKQVYHLPIALRVETGRGSHCQTLALRDRQTSFSLNLESNPTRLELDPHIDVFRQLHPEELPASINSIKGAESVSLVLAEGTGQAGRRTARMLIRSLGLTRARIIPEGELKTGRRDDSCLVFIGYPTKTDRLPEETGPVSLFPDRFRIGKRTFDQPTETFFGVFQPSGAAGRTIGILYPVQSELGPTVARKATHYGKYSYLAFQGGNNQAKGVWPVTDSPLVVDWQE